MICPACGEGTITLTCYTEYQGESPHGGLVTFIDDFEQEDCDCKLTDDQINFIYENGTCEDYYDYDYD